MSINSSSVSLDSLLWSSQTLPLLNLLRRSAPSGVSQLLITYSPWMPSVFTQPFFVRPWGAQPGKKNPPANAGVMGSSPGSGGEEGGNPTQYS